MKELNQKCIQKTKNKKSPGKRRNVVVNLGFVLLADALGNPHNVTTLLLLQLHKLFKPETT